MKKTCSECHLKHHVIPVVKRVDGSLVVVCRRCAERLDYGLYLRLDGE